MTDRSDDWQARWLTGETTDRPDDWQARRLTGQTTDGRDDWQARWLTGEMTDRPDDWQARWLTGEMTDRPYDWHARWPTGQTTDGRDDWQARRLTGQTTASWLVCRPTADRLSLYSVPRSARLTAAPPPSLERRADDGVARRVGVGRVGRVGRVQTVEVGDGGDVCDDGRRRVQLVAVARVHEPLLVVVLAVILTVVARGRRRGRGRGGRQRLLLRADRGDQLHSALLHQLRQRRLVVVGGTRAEARERCRQTTGDIGQHNCTTTIYWPAQLAAFWVGVKITIAVTLNLQ